MKINKVTITGADDSVNINSLVDLQKKYPFVEWGILFSLKNTSHDRYPSSDWLGRFFAFIFKEKLNVSAHLCGTFAKEFMLGKISHDSIANTLSHLFPRLQINFNFKTSGEFDLEKVVEFLKTKEKNEFIFQYNKSNESVLKDFLTKEKDLKNINMLFDSSGGRGTIIKQISTPLNVYTGYAGGLNPDNISDFCKKVVAFPNDSRVWIDTESGVRTNDKFDLTKVEKFLDIASKFITYDY